MFTHLAMEISRGQGKKIWENWKEGDRVQHIGTKEWATILRIQPQADNTCELELERDPGAFSTSRAYWASYHISDHKAAE
jgi:hypothetical protein